MSGWLVDGWLVEDEMGWDIREGRGGEGREGSVGIRRWGRGGCFEPSCIHGRGGGHRFRIAWR